MITRNSNGIELNTHIGTWSVIDETIHNGKTVFLLEHEKYGDETEYLAVDEHGNIIADEIYDDWLGHLEDL